MASKKRRGGWSGFVSRKRTEYVKETKSLDREYIPTDRINVPALILSRKHTEGVRQEVTVVLGAVHPGCIGAKGLERCKYIERDDGKTMLTILPEYSYNTSQAYKGRESYLKSNFPITKDDMFNLVSGRIYKFYCKIARVPPDDFTLVELINFSITCDVSEPWGSSVNEHDVGSGSSGGSSADVTLEKSFFVKVSSIRETAKPKGVPLLQMLYSCNSVIRSLPHYDKIRNQVETRVEAAETFSAGNNSAGAKIMTKLWKMKSWQNRWMPEHPDIMIFQLGSPSYFLAKYFEQKESGCDKEGRQFILTPLGEGSTLHEDDVMEFHTRTSQLDSTPIAAWRFIAHVFQAKLKSDSIDKKEEEIGEDDIEESMQHTVKFTMFEDVCRQIGFPDELESYRMMMSVYYPYFPFAFSCKLDAKGTARRPENSEKGSDKSGYAVKVENIVGPLKEFWETIGIPISPDVASRLLDTHSPSGRFLSTDSLPSAKHEIYCLSDLGETEISIDTAASWYSSGNYSLFAVICKNTSRGVIVPSLHKALKDMSVWAEGNDAQGNVVIGSLFFDEEYDQDEMEEDHSLAHAILKSMDFFEEERWSHEAPSYIRAFVYATKRSTPMDSLEKTSVMSFLGV